MFRPAPAFNCRKAAPPSVTSSLFWFSVVLVWLSPIASFGEWSIVVTFGILVAVLGFGKPHLSTSVLVIGIYAVMALMLRLVDFAIDTTWSLPPVGFGKELVNNGQVAVYVATRDMPEYVHAVASMEKSYDGKDISNSLVDLSAQARSARLGKLMDSIQGFAAQAGIPQLDLVVLDVGSQEPLKEGSVGKARVEHIAASGDSGIPVFHAWEHIARTSTADQVMFFDEDVLIPAAFKWKLYLRGTWFFKKQFRDYSACWSAPRTAVVDMVARLRATPHLYTESMRWGGQEDKLAIYAMDLQKAPDELLYFKLPSSRTFQDFISRMSWQDTTRVFDRYMLEWNRQGEPSSGFTQNINGPLSRWSTKSLLKGYGIWCLVDLLLLLEMQLVPPTGTLKWLLRHVVDTFFIFENSFPASVQTWRRHWLSEDMVVNVIIDGGAAAFVLATFASVSVGAVGIGKRCTQPQHKLDGKVDGPDESDPLLA